ncbi:MAG: S1 RNA-binding domain-containing protein [Clostridiales bacterium]|nr:S1 RNA-binding domain-containing protein [Clostridiales bacterium]
MQIEVGMVLSGKVTGITSFGAFVELPEGKSGLVHISEIATEFVENVSDHLKKGQIVKVKVIGNDNGKISLSIKQLQQDEAADKSKKQKDKKKKRVSQPRSTQPPEEFEFVRKNSSGEMSFDDMLQKFKHDSDEKFQDLKRSNDNKRSGGYKRAY